MARKIPNWRFSTTALSITIGLLLLVNSIGKAASAFLDIQGIPQQSAIEALAAIGVVNGIAPDQFAPQQPVNRAQMATLVIRALGKSDASPPENAQTFSDVAPNHWARSNIALANSLGIIRGSEGKFYPDDQVTYAQAVTMLVRALGYEETVTGGYPIGYIVRAKELGLLSQAELEINSTLSRAHASQLLYNAIYLVPQAGTGQTLSQSIFRQVDSISVEVIPAFAVPGLTVELRVQAQDRSGNPVSLTDAEVHVLSGDAVVDGQDVHVRGSGSVTVQVRYKSLTRTVNIPVASSLAIRPDRADIGAGSSISLKAVAVVDGREVSVQPDWSVGQGSGAVTSEGVFSPAGAGRAVIRAQLGQLSSSTAIRAVGSVAITDAPAWTAPGQVHQMKANVDGDSSNGVTWAATGATISATGVLSNVTGDSVVVTASVGELRSSVSIPVLKRLRITPEYPFAQQGAQIAFSVFGVDASGNEHIVTPIWERSNAAVGIINEKGQFVGTGLGATDVVAKVGSLEARTVLRVTGPASRLMVSASETSLPVGAGATTKIVAKLVDTSGNTSAVDDQPIQFVTTDSSKGKLSQAVVLSKSGEASTVFNVGESAGTLIVSASAPGLNLPNDSVTLSLYQAQPATIELRASPSPLASGGGVTTITAVMLDNRRFPVPAPQAVTISISAVGNAGNLAATQITIPQGKSSSATTFISSGTPGSSVISGAGPYPVTGVTISTVVPGPAAKVRIQPIVGSTPVTGLNSLKVYVDIMDSAGVVRANDNITKVNLTVTPPAGLLGQTGSSPIRLESTAANGTAVFDIPATAVGTADLSASLADETGEAATAQAIFSPGVPALLKLGVQDSTIPADGITYTTLHADVVDSNGIVLRSLNPVVVFRRLSPTGATAASGSLQVRAVDGRASITIRSSGTPGTDVWYATTDGLETTNVVTVTASSDMANPYTLRASGSTAFQVGTSNTITVQVVDRQGRLVTGDSGRVITASHSLAGVTITTTSVITNGQATFSIIGTQATSGVITFSTSALPLNTISVPVSFGSVGTAYSLFASSSSTSVRVGNQVTVWVRVMDNQGLVLSTDSGRIVSASLNGYGTLSSSQVSVSGGIATFIFTGVSPGTAVLSFTSSGLPQPSTSLTITITN